MRLRIVVTQQIDMECIIRPLVSEDETFLWEMLYHALYVSEGQIALPREVIHIPEIARYLRGLGTRRRLWLSC